MASPDVRLATARLEKAVADDRSPEALHDVGVALTIEGRLDDGINALSESASRAPSDARVWTDLAAAFLARDRPDDASGASDAARRALTLAPSSHAARFNRALALERFHLDPEAIAEWEAYLRADAESEWAQEARTHIAKLSSASTLDDWQSNEAALRDALRRRAAPTVANSVAKFPQQSREFVFDTLLPEWAEDVRDHPDRAAAALDDVRMLAEAVATRGDYLALDAVRAISATGDRGLEPLARGHLAFAHGRASSGAYRYTEADVSLAEAEQCFIGRSPVAAWATMLRAIVIYQRNDLSQARDKLLTVQQAIGDRRYPALLAQVDWTLGIIGAGQGDFTGAFDHYRSALTALETIGETENATAVQSLLAETTRLLGDVKGSWSQEIAALSHLHELRRPQRKQTVAMMAGQAALRQGRPAAALDFQNRFLEAARETRSQTSIAEAYLYRARVYRNLPDPPRARDDLAAARLALQSATESGIAAYLTAQIQLEEAFIGTDGDSKQLVEGVTAALEYFRSSSRSAWLPRVYLARSRLLLRRNETARAEADLLAGIETLEKQRKTVSSDALRVSYLDETWDLFDEMISLQMRLGHQREAFAFAERGRARSLLDSAGESDQRALDPTHVAANLPPGAVMLYFAVIRSHAIVWVLSATAQRCVVLNATGADLEKLVRSYRRALDAGRETLANDLAVSLYAELIKPIEADLPAKATLVIAPDGALHQVPFAAFRPTAGGAFLVESHAVVVAPSARAFLRSLSAESYTPARQTAVVIGNPTSDTLLELPALPGAEREAKDVAASYPGALTLTRGEATRDRFMAIAPHASVIHIAAHAVANEEFPDLSRLFLAPANGRSGGLTVNDLGHLDFAGTRLVVLAACGTAAGATFRGEGVSSLARPFLAKGVPQVIGTLWQVDDETSWRVFTSFHRAYAGGISAATALQQAQLAVIRDPANRSSNWAAMVLLGSVDSVLQTTRTGR